MGQDFQERIRFLPSYPCCSQLLSLFPGIACASGRSLAQGLKLENWKRKQKNALVRQLEDHLLRTVRDQEGLVFATPIPVAMEPHAWRTNKASLASASLASMEERVKRTSTTVGLIRVKMEAHAGTRWIMILDEISSIPFTG